MGTQHTRTSQDPGGAGRGARSEEPAGATARERLLAGLPVSERRVPLGGGATAVLEGGEGPPLVLLHGPSSHALAWMRVLPALVTRHRVIAPDLPGHGASEVLGGPAEAGVLRWVDDLIEHTCPGPPILVGHILGGAIAARYAAERGRRLGGLVLVDTLGLTAFQPTPEFGRALAAFLADPTAETHEGLWRRCASDFSALRRGLGERWISLAAYDLDRARTPALAAAQHAMMAALGVPAIAPATLARIAVPTALIWGRHDPATALSVARDASARFGWPLHVIEEAGADAALEQPAAFVDALRAALGAGTPPGARGDRG